MKRLLLCAGLDGSQSALEKLTRCVEARNPDGILFAGGIRAPGSRLGRQNAEMEYKRLFDALGAAGRFAAVIPGPHDAPLREFYLAAMTAEVDHPGVHVVHGTPVERPPVAISGVGGELTENEDRADEQLWCSRATAEYLLRTLWRTDQPRRILLLSVPPSEPLGGGQANAIAGEIVDSYHPDLCVVAGPTDHRGTERIAHTLVVNPGRLADGSAAWLDWRNEAQPVIMLDLD